MSHIYFAGVKVMGNPEQNHTNSQTRSYET